METIAQRIVRRAAERSVGGVRFGTRSPASPIEPMVIVHAVHDDFGTGLFGDHSPNDVQDSINLIDARMSALSQSAGNLGPTWVQRDPAGYTSWATDFAALQSRYAGARAAASSATIPIIGAFSANSAYDALLKAIKQSAPPDGGPMTKGDLDDLERRLVAAGGQSVSPAVLPQPTSTDLDMAMYGNAGFQAAANAGQVAAGTIGSVASAVGTLAVDATKAAGNVADASKSAFDFVAWLTAHKAVILAVGGGVIGLMILGAVVPLLATAPKGVKAVATLGGALV